MSEAVEKATRVKPVFYVASVIEKFETKAEAEAYVTAHELGSDEVVLKGRALSTEEQIKTVLN